MNGQQILNILIISYIFIASLVILFSKTKQKSHQVIFFINCLILVWEIFPLISSNYPAWMGIFYDFFPLLFLPLFHRETEYLTTAFGQPTYDNQFIQFDKKYFPYIMNIHYHNRANSKALSEFLHLCYLSFYFLIYGVPLYFYFKQDYLYFYESLFAILFLLFSCYITHGIIPVSGPRTIFTKINDHRSEGFFFRLVHKVLEGGSTHGTAFPSGHTGVACVVMLITWHIHTPLFYFILPFALGLIISTIYGRFHYVTDLLCGLAYAIIAFFITIWIYG